MAGVTTRLYPPYCVIPPLMPCWRQASVNSTCAPCCGVRQTWCSDTEPACAQNVRSAVTGGCSSRRRTATCLWRGYSGSLTAVAWVRRYIAHWLDLDDHQNANIALIAGRMHGVSSRVRMSLVPPQNGWRVGFMVAIAGRFPCCSMAAYPWRNLRASAIGAPNRGTSTSLQRKAIRKLVRALAQARVGVSVRTAATICTVVCATSAKQSCTKASTPIAREPDATICTVVCATSAEQSCTKASTPIRTHGPY